jgi:hypothetical protein
MNPVEQEVRDQRLGTDQQLDAKMGGSQDAHMVVARGGGAELDDPALI